MAKANKKIVISEDPSFKPFDDELPTTSKDALESRSSVASASAPYACICCEGKCQLDKDYLETQSELDGDPPVLINSPSMARDSKDTVTVKILSPPCNCANCPLRNFCKCNWPLSKRIGYANCDLLLYQLPTDFTILDCRRTQFNCVSMSRLSSSSRENFIQQVFTICQDSQGDFNENFDFIGSVVILKYIIELFDVRDRLAIKLNALWTFLPTS